MYCRPIDYILEWLWQLEYWIRVGVGAHLSEKSGKLQCLRSMAVLSNAAVGLAMSWPAICMHAKVLTPYGSLNLAVTANI
jgi:hypothetical protein